MPFIKNDRRAPLSTGDILPEAPGDICYLEYVRLLEEWKENPRWTTIHNMCKRILTETDDIEDDDDKFTARFLAFMVIWQKYGWPYELDRIEEHGDIN